MSTARVSNDIPTTSAIAAALTAAGDYNTNGSDWPAAATALLGALGYRSERIPAGQSGDLGDFMRRFPTDNPNTQSERDFLNEARSVHILFQFTNYEIRETTQPALLEATGFDTDNLDCFMFVAVELDGNSYPRGKYAAFTRELNRRIGLPTVILFRTAGNKVTLGFVQHRPNRRNPERDVLGSVSLIREINPADSHHAHRKILAELSLPERLRWLARNGKPANFDGLLAAWLDALDTEALNNRFYRELLAWFERALKTAEFPDGPARTLGKEEHVIRLITRLMFVWFIKEKGLVAEELFDGPQAEQLLKDYDRARGDSYYRAVLQNLFFATLNTEIQSRRFSRGTNADHRNFSVYRYREEMAQPDKLAKLFDQTPFINGGLFDCLDSFDSTRDGGVRVDCFTDVPRQRAGYSIPNRLLFGDPDNPDVDPGLIDLFHRYKFTVEENTPTEQEVALDPELLGKVFENLLAAVNPETRLTARKETGSYYTPRAVVDYMVDEALVAALAQKTAPADGDVADWQTRLRALLDYAAADAAAETRFTLTERKAIVGAIAGLRVLDPAVGSGAFPMGILHKLTLALRRLDPGNELWEELQKGPARQRADAAFNIADQTERDAELREISETFERYRDSDFGRKLYLIQNSIYGVDWQPIAIQIAKLRFFISLTIEQEPNRDPGGDPGDPDRPGYNYGIRPLPNLETRFVAADTLRALEKPAQIPLRTAEVQRLEGELAANRERHFHANNRADKLAYQKQYKQLRQEMGEALRNVDFPAVAAEQVAAWDPFDQNAAPAGWFDPEYMFNVTDGFDIVIGNPPYIQLQKEGGRLANRYQDAGYQTFARTGDIYQLFYERGCQLLTPARGLLAYITSNSWLKAEYGKSTRRYFAENHPPLRLLEMGKDVFESAIVDSCVLIAHAGRRNGVARAVDLDKLAVKDFPPEENLWGELRPDGEKPWSILTAVEQSVMDKIEAAGTPLKDWDVSIYRGVTTGYNNAFVIDNATKEALVAADPKSAEIIKPVLRGRDIQRYRAQWSGLWLIYARKGVRIDRYPAVYAHLQKHQDALSKKSGANEWYEFQGSPSDTMSSAFEEEKLLWMDLTERGRFAYDQGEMFAVNTVFMLSGGSVKYLCALLNSDLMTWYMGNTALNSGMGVTRWIRHTVERLPIPRISGARQRPFIRLVERILAAKGSNPAADTSGEEAELDRLVYALYGLTAEEAGAVGG